MKTLEFFLVQMLCTHVLTVSSWFGSKLKKKTDERLCACTFMPNSCIISLRFSIYVDGDVGMSNQIDSNPEMLLSVTTQTFKPAFLKVQKAENKRAISNLR